jgi:Macrocin-O-methyltransferase (TylF)
VAFYKGYFRYSMPEYRERNHGPVAILRMDGNMYESTMGAKKSIQDALHMSVCNLEVCPGGLANTMLMAGLLED